MGTLHPVRAMLGSVTRLVSSGALVLSLGATALTAHADEWKDPLETPSVSTLKAHSSLLLDVALAGDRVVAAGERGHIIFSDDDGQSWRQANVPVINTFTAIYFADAKTGWAVGHDGVIVKTQDSGENWAKQFDGFQANEKVLAQAKVNLAKYEKAYNQAEASGDDDAIDEAQDALDNATYALEDAQYDLEDRSTKPFLDVWFKDANTGFVIGAYGMIFKTTDGGQSWTDWSGHVDNPDRFHLNSIVSVDADRLMIVGEAGLMLRSKDAGNEFEQMFSPYEGSFFSVINLNQQDVQLAYGLRGNVARSDNFGSTWKLIESGTEQSLIGATDRLGRVAYVVGNGGAFLKGIDLGRQWESKIRDGRGSAAAIVESKAGHFVIVGERGVELLDKAGNKLALAVKSVKG